MPKTIKNAVETEFRGKDRMTRSLGVMSRGMQRLNRMAGRVKRGLFAAGRAAVFLGRAAGRVAVAGLVGIAGAATALFYSVTKLAGGMDELAKTTRALDFDIEKFQEFRFAAEQSGVAGDKFNKSVTKFSKTVGELKGGYGSMFTALKKTNPQLLRQLKNTTNTSDAFELYLKSIRETPGAMKKAALATAAFGRDGVAMVNLANNSAEELENLRAQMRQNGVVTAEQAAKAEAFNDSMNRLKLTAKGLAVDALSPLMPLLERGADSLRAWIIENRGLIKQKIETVFKNMVKFGKQAFNFLKTNIPPLIDKLKKIGKDGFAWIKENEPQIREFIDTLKSFGKMLVKLVGFAIKHKNAILALGAAYVALRISLAAMNFASFMQGAGAAGASAAGLSGKVKGLAGMVGKGGLLVAAFAAGWAVGSVIFDKWNNAASNLALNAENMAARVSMSFRKMSDDQLKTTDRTLAAQEQKLTSTFESVKAFVTGNYQEHQSAIRAVKDARIKGLTEQFGRLSRGNELVKEREKLGFMAGRQSGGVGDQPALNPVDMPQAQVSRSETVTREVTEVVIRDETGRAEVTKGKSTAGLTLAHTGGM